ncbi:MAG: transporter substrate-binding domain-containing protein [Hyphomicrobiales bacterium]|nr:transporter substrate-binding domain-containing protein [Hyphomicrobiales bacterium]
MTRAGLVCLLAGLMGLPLCAVAGDTVRVGFKSGKAPYVMASAPYTDSDYDMTRRLGIEVSLVQEALAPFGKTVHPVYMNFHRMPRQLLDGKIDAASNVPGDLPGVLYVERFLRLRDHIIVRADLGRQVAGLGDLTGLRVAAFQRAKDFLGDDYRAAVATFASYHEIDDQKNQVLLFLAGRADALVIELGIFKYWAKALGGEQPGYHATPLLKDPFWIGVGFRDPALRDQFVDGLARLVKSGRYDQIYAEYLD